jgi:hypothetical protein
VFKTAFNIYLSFYSFSGISIQIIAKFIDLNEHKMTHKMKLKNKKSAVDFDENPVEDPFYEMKMKI